MSQSGCSDFSQPSTDQIVGEEFSSHKVDLAIQDGLRALLHQCLTANPEYTRIIEAVSKLEDKIENCEGHKVPCTKEAGKLRPGPGNSSASVWDGFDFDGCQHPAANDDLRKARAERDVMLKRVYDEEVLPVVIKAANDATIRAPLEKFGRIVQRAQQEDEIYELYIGLCHAALDHFRTIPQRTTLPDANPTLDIRFLTTATRSLVSLPVCDSPKGIIQRKPDIICTSRAAEQVLRDETKTSTGSVGKAAWPCVLQCVEVKKGTKTSVRIPDRSKMFEATDFEMTVSSSTTNPSPDQGTNARKRKHENPVATGGQHKRSRTQSKHSSTSKPQPPDPPQYKTASEAQTGAYALAMFSHSQGVKHAINLIVRDQRASIMLINRQNVFVTKPFDILNEFPHFLAMLFLLQRFTFKNWGIVPTLNPSAVAALKGNTELPQDIVFDFETDCHHRWSNNPTSPIVIKPDLCTLQGRATGVRRAVLGTPAEGQEGFVCKIYNPEVARPHEGKTLEALHALAKAEEPGQHMRNHLPVLKAYVDIADTDTRWLRSLLNRPIEGHRVTRVVVLEELWPLERTLKVGTNNQGETVGDEGGRTFIKAWLDIVKCHAFLWKNLVEHGDPSLNNAMFNPRLKCGVLIDFDFSVFRWGPRMPGTGRTGTIPFMSVRLLYEEYWAGEIIRQYFDELEALCWILPYVWLGGTKAGSRVDDWKTSSYTDCRRVKSDFLRSPQRWEDEYEPETTRLFVHAIVSDVLTEASHKLVSTEKKVHRARRFQALGQDQEDAMPSPERYYLEHDQEVLDLFLAVVGEQTSLIPSNYVANFPRPSFAKPTTEEIARIISIVGTDQ